MMSWEEEEGPGARPHTTFLPRLECSWASWASRNGDQRPGPSSGHMVQEHRTTLRDPVAHPIPASQGVTCGSLRLSSWKGIGEFQAKLVYTVRICIMTGRQTDRQGGNKVPEPPSF